MPAESLNRRLPALAAALCLTVGVLLGSSGTAHATVPGFSIFEGTPSTSQAGGHPDVDLHLEFNIDYQAGAEQLQCETEDPAVDCLSPRALKIHWPAGFIGNPHVAAQCTLSEFNQSACPVDAQVGKVVINGEEFGNSIYGWVPLYNMQTRPDQAGELAFFVGLFGSPIFLELTGRTDGDYGLDAITSPIIPLPFNNLTTTLWGVPQDPSHDFERFVTPLSGLGVCIQGAFFGNNGCDPGGFFSPTHAKATLPEKPFLQNPTTCGIPLTLKGEIEYYNGRVGFGESPWPATTGCDQSSFNPSVVAKPTTSRADTASGLDTDLKVPQPQSPDTPSPSELRTSTVTLPEGFTINPAAADGKVLCPQALSGFGTLLGATCPDFSRIGTSLIDVAALPEPIPGALYLAEPLPGDPYRVLLTGDGFGTHIKLFGSIKADPQTGRISFVFDDLPQSPLQEFQLHVFGSERGVLATPEHCGSFPVESEFVPWNSSLNPRSTLSFISVESGPNGTPCPSGPRPFAPNIRAGMENSTAGSASPFTFTLRRADGDQYLTGFKVQSPPGFTASLAGVAYCPEAALAKLNDPNYSGLAERNAPACPAGSQIGTVVAGAGPGTHPLYTGGKVYLAGPYKGAPLSLVAVVPAVSGPYDLGTVATRAAIDVNRETVQVTTTSDPLPRIFGGIPLRVRYIRIQLDRPNFTHSPTNCSPLSIDSSMSGDEGGATTINTPFQVANCDELAYKPRMSLRLSGGVGRLGHPTIHAVVRAGGGEANTHSLVVTLPKGELLDNNHIGAVCTRVDFDAGNCPSTAVIGSAEVQTPLLDQPLRGKVYLRSSQQGLPDLAVDLNGQLHVVAIGHVKSVAGRFRTVFDAIPDVPFSKIVFDLAGGSVGLLQNSETLCGKNKRFTAAFTAHDEVRRTTSSPLRVRCGKTSSRKHRGTGHRGKK